MIRLAGRGSRDPRRSLLSSESLDDGVELRRDAKSLKFVLDQLGVEVRFNSRARQNEFRQGRSDWQPANDRMEAALQDRIASTFKTQGMTPLLFGSDSWRRSLNALLAENEVDPFVAWLEDLPEWDGEPRLESWLGEVFTVDREDPLTSWASQFIFLGPVWRAFRPGTKLDEMPVLIGPQRCGKSTSLRFILPPEHPEWFTDGLHLAAAAKAQVEALQGRVIVEAAEMAGSTRAEIERLKSFLSRTDDGNVRLAYRRNPEPLLRRAVVVGTTNQTDPLPNDPAGNRRFVIVRVRPRPDRCDRERRLRADDCPYGQAELTEDQHCPDCGALPVSSVKHLRQYLGWAREQLWAEALHLHRAGTEARLPEDLADVQAATNEAARRRDELLEDKLADWLEQAPERFTLAQAAIGCRLVDSGSTARVSMQNQRRLGAALQTAGYSKRRSRIDGKRKVLWSRR